MDRLRVGLGVDRHVDYTVDGDGLTGYQVHPSGALLIYSGIDRPAKWVWSFGTWATVEVDPSN